MPFLRHCRSELVDHMQDCRLPFDQRFVVLDQVEDCILRHPKDKGGCYFKARRQVSIQCSTSSIKEDSPRHSLVWI